MVFLITCFCRVIACAKEIQGQFRSLLTIEEQRRARDSVSGALNYKIKRETHSQAEIKIRGSKMSAINLKFRKRKGSEMERSGMHA